jgi:hypothetical protein
MDIDTITVCFIILPLTFEDITVNMPKLSFSTSLVVPPVTFIAGTIRPNLDTVAMLHVS